VRSAGSAKSTSLQYRWRAIDRILVRSVLRISCQTFSRHAIAYELGLETVYNGKFLKGWRPIKPRLGNWVNTRWATGFHGPRRRRYYVWMEWCERKSHLVICNNLAMCINMGIVILLWGAAKEDNTLLFSNMFLPMVKCRVLSLTHPISLIFLCTRSRDQQYYYHFLVIPDS